MVEDLIEESSYEPELVAAPARRMLARRDRPTAVFASNDYSAIATLQAAVELGIKVPEELSVIGFDNIPESAFTTPPLTTVNQPIRRSGECAVELLLQLMKDEAVTHRDIVLPTELVVRASTGPEGVQAGGTKKSRTPRQRTTGRRWA